MGDTSLKGQNNFNLGTTVLIILHETKNVFQK